jgi:hypothetical protein
MFEASEKRYSDKIKAGEARQRETEHTLHTLHTYATQHFDLGEKVLTYLLHHKIL